MNDAHSTHAALRNPRRHTLEWGRNAVCVLMALLYWFAVAALHAQQPVAQQPAGNAASASESQSNAGLSADPFLASYEGQNVVSIDVAGRPQAAANQFSPLFVQKAGEPFSMDKIGQTVSALKTAGASSEVRVQVEPDARGVRVLFVLEPAVYFGIFEFPGAQRFAYSRLIQASNYPVQTPFNLPEVEHDRQTLANYLRQGGYFQVNVDAHTNLDLKHSLANIDFVTTLGPRAKFGEIDIANISPAQQTELAHSLRTPFARLRGAAIRPGRTYNRSTLNRATQSLQNNLEKKGWLAAQVKLDGAEYHADTNRADIHFNASLGPMTHVEIDGAHLWSWTRKSILPVYQGVGVDDETVQEGRQALESYFQAKGYFDAKVTADLKHSATSDTVVYRIAKEKKHKVESVKLSGNKTISSDELTPRITVKESHFLSKGKFSNQMVRSSVNNLTAIYKSEGFSSVSVASHVVNNGGDIGVSFQVVEGPRDIVDNLSVDGADTLSQSRYAPAGLKLAAGQPYSQAHVAQDRAAIVANYLKAGYLNASFRETATAVSKSEPHRIDVVYHIYEGPKVYTADILTLGRAHTQQRLIDRDIASIKLNTPLTETELLTAGSKLYDHTGVFDWAEVEPKRQITDQSTEDVLVKVHEGKKNEITYGFGFEVINRGGSIPSGTVTLPNLPPVGLPSSFTTSQKTFYGPRGTFQYTRNNVLGKGDSISFTGFAGRLDQRGAAYFIVPNLNWSQWKATVAASAEVNEENPIFSAREEQGSYQVQRTIDAAKKNMLFFRYGYSHVNLTRVEIQQLVPDADRNVRLSTLSANLTRDTRDNPLDEHRGVLDSIELDFNDTKLGSSVNFAKMTMQSAYYKQGFHNIVWAASVRVGLAQPFSNSRVPLSEEFFTGGGNSLRGFPLDGAGPQRSVCVSNSSDGKCLSEIRVPSGGNELLIFNAEARIPLAIKKGLSLVTFYDGGNVFPDVGFHDFTSLYSNNIGLGLRYATPVGPIRVDLGRNLNPISGINATQYFISIGQAF